MDNHVFDSNVLIMQKENKLDNERVGQTCSADPKPELSALGKDAMNTLHSIVSRSFVDIEKMITVKCIVPEGYYRVGSVSQKQQTQGLKNLEELAKKFSAPLISSILVSLGLALDAPALAIVLLSGGGTALGGYIEKKIGSNNEYQQQTVPLLALQANDIEIKVTIDADKQEEIKNSAYEEINQVCKAISAYQKKMEERFDIGTDRMFGEWVQRFLMYSETRQDDRHLQVLRDQLLDRLAAMKIQVYSDVELNESGKPDIPIQDYLYDHREGDEYHQVTRPAVFSDRALLARGEII